MLAVTQLAFGAMATLGAMAASASDIPTARTVTGGTLTWAVSDVLGRPGDGSTADKAKIEVSGGAEKLSDGAVRFPAKGGAFDPATGRAVVTYAGSVTLTVEHRTVSVAAPQVLVDGERSALRATVTGPAQVHGTAVAIDVARLAATRPHLTSGSVSWADLAATATEQGAASLAPLTTSTGSLGPVSLGVTVGESADPDAQRELALALAAESPTPSASASVSPSGSPSASPSTSSCPSPSASTSGSPSPSASASTSPSTSPSASASASTSPSASASPSTSPSASPSASPSNSPCASPSPSPSESPSETPTDGGPSTTYTTIEAANSNTLAKTGDGFLVPLTMAGVALIVGGVFTLRIARRGGYASDDF
ncbi:HtaA domain-containing protein [Planotetraspora silvatica]|uniref:HtaA domain-containing protein n=1 Tax=Planotetraspora silvatica TaxID=234614 RepID=UPI00194EB1BC|nr:HtaA domain-containing protein [Planotetraspora silvatica]